jgi:hypothetical protein
MCALVKRTFVRCSSFVGELRSSHWNARLIFAKAKTPFQSRSPNRLADVSCVMTRDTNEELLLMMLFLGFLRFDASFAATGGAASAGFPSPNWGAVTAEFKKVGGFFRASRVTRDNFTPVVGGVGSVARGLGFMIGASDGWGGGVARRRSSWSMYVPVPI